jgi:hypothetical protein
MDLPLAVTGAGDAGAYASDDIAQGSTGDCWFLSGLAGHARAKEGVPEPFAANLAGAKDGTFKVTFWLRDGEGQPNADGRRKTEIWVDADLPRSGVMPAYEWAMGEEHELWVAILEKALAKHYGGYEQISGDLRGDDDDCFAMLSGLPSERVDLDDLTIDQMLEKLSWAKQHHRGVRLNSWQLPRNPSAFDRRKEQEAKTYGVQVRHGYSLEDVDRESRTVSLRDPSGANHLDKVSADVVKAFFSALLIAAA